MKKLAEIIVNGRYVILPCFIILTIISAVLSGNVKENSDMTRYLPVSSQTKIGTDIMNEEFQEEDDKSSTLNLMFSGLDEEQKIEVLNTIEAIEGVSEVDYDDSEDYNKDDYTLYEITVDDKDSSEIAEMVYNTVNNIFSDYEMVTGGSISEYQRPILPMWIMAVAVLLVLIILLIMCNSYIEPFLFLTCIFIAIIINRGTNIIFGTISNITGAISAILQLALSMDYSIMLMERYRQECEVEEDKKTAMKSALCSSFQSISGSSVTTIVGLLTLVFMSFTIGKDLGLVLAKGVLLSLVCIFLVLPALILIFDKWITKTMKKSPNIRLDALGRFTYKFKVPVSILFVAIFILSYFLQGSMLISYTGTEDTTISDVFGLTNQLAIVYNNEDEAKIRELYDELEANERIETVLGYGNTIDEELPYDEMIERLQDLDDTFSIEDYLMKILYYKYYHEDIENTMTIYDLLHFIQDEVYNKEEMEDEITDEVKKDIDRLMNFADTELMNQPRSVEEIASILEMDETDIKNVMVLYQSKHNNIKLTIPQFISFIKNVVLNDEEYSKYIDAETREDIDEIEKYMNVGEIQKQRTSSEMASYLDLSESDAKKLYVFYAKNQSLDLTMTPKQFADFMLGDVLNDSDFNDLIDEDTKDSLNTLQDFSDKDVIEKEVKSSELAKLLDIDKETVRQIMLLYYTNHDLGVKMTLQELLADISSEQMQPYLTGVDLSALNQVSVFIENENNFNTTKLPKAGLKAVFDGISPGMVESIYMLGGLPESATFSPQEFISYILQLSGNLSETEEVQQLKILQKVIKDSANPKSYTDAEAAKLLGIEKAQLTQIYKLYGTVTQTNVNQLTIEQLLAFMLSDEVKASLDAQTVATLEKLFVFAKNENNMNTAALSKSQLDTLFAGVKQGIASQIYALCGYEDSKTMTPEAFVDVLIEKMQKPIDDESLESLQTLSNIIDASVSGKKLKANETAELFGLKKSQVYALYTLHDYMAGNVSKWKLTPYKFVSFALDNDTVRKQMDSNSKKSLEKLKKIMKAAINETTYYDAQLSGLLEMDADTIKSVYALYKYKKQTVTVAAPEFVDFLLEHQKDEELEDNLDQESIDDLELLQKVIRSVIGNIGYTAAGISETFEFSEDDIKLLYGLYSFNSGNNTMDLKTTANFVLTDVVDDKEYGSSVDEDSQEKLETLVSVMDGSVSQKTYNKDELLEILGTFGTEIERDTIELLYIYYGSDTGYDNSQMLTAEQLIAYLNDDIITDERFDDFIDDEQRTDIVDAQESLEDAKKLLIGKEHSRIVLYTEYEYEEAAVYDFIENIRGKLAGISDDAYLIGDSTMAYEMNQSFWNEFQFMSILTMVAIFIVVVFTFKSVTTSLILVFIIQCAVYITMGVMAFSGSAVYFISTLIVQSILMGATIDYAILYTSYYKEHRKEMDMKEAIISSYNKSIGTIVTSASILIIATFIVGNHASVIIAKICKSISIGVSCATVLILLIAPSVIAVFDKWVVGENLSGNGKLLKRLKKQQS